MTPYDVHHGLAPAIWQQRAEALRVAFEAHPERFPHGLPTPPPLPTEVWINKPSNKTITVAPSPEVGL